MGAPDTAGDVTLAVRFLRSVFCIRCRAAAPHRSRFALTSSITSRAGNV
jgi:hypothetical protein